MGQRTRILRYQKHGQLKKKTLFRHVTLKSVFYLCRYHSDSAPDTRLTVRGLRIRYPFMQSGSLRNAGESINETSM